MVQQLEEEVLEIDRLVGELLASSRLEFSQLEKRELVLRLVDLEGSPLTTGGANIEVTTVDGGGIVVRAATRAQGGRQPGPRAAGGPRPRAWSPRTLR